MSHISPSQIQQWFLFCPIRLLGYFLSTCKNIFLNHCRSKLKTVPLFTIKYWAFPMNKDILYIITVQVSKSRNLTLIQQNYLIHSSDFINWPNTVLYSYFFSCPDSNPGFCIALSCFNCLTSFNLEQLSSWPLFARCFLMTGLRTTVAVMLCPQCICQDAQDTSLSRHWLCG